jgi:hypothetical protein
MSYHADDIMTVKASGGNVYSVHGMNVLSTGDELVKLRSSKHSEVWRGEWASTSRKWTDSLKVEVA